jgi:hypothetical protein
MSTVKTNAILDASGGNTATINSMTPTADSLQGFRNRIINGAMVIDQRNAGASVTLDSNGVYPVDRWRCDENTDGAATGEQVQDVPTGFVNSLKITTTTADGSLSSNQYMAANQFIEGFNTDDLMWGTANAKTITLSFWVRSSLTGTFAAGIDNNAGDRSYVFNYTISSANTFEYKTVTIAGDTSGTWLTNNQRGLGLRFALGAGTNFDGTVGSWQAGSKFSSSGAVSVIGTLNATWYITGVQLEVGSVATPFERRDYGRELMLCQRYFQTLVVSTGSAAYLSSFVATSTTEGLGVTFLPVPMRAAPALAITLSGGTTKYRVNTGNTDQNSDTNPTIANATATSFRLNFTGFTGLTAGNTGWVNNRDSTAGYFGVTSEL